MSEYGEYLAGICELLDSAVTQLKRIADAAEKYIALVFDEGEADEKK